MKKIFVTLAAFALFIVVGCLKETPIETTESHDTPVTERDWCFGLSNQEIAGIGQMHNTYAINILEHFNMNAKDYKEELLSQIARVNPNANLELASTCIDLVATGQSQGDAVANRFNNAVAQNYYNTIVAAVENAQNYQSLLVQLNALQNQVSQLQNCADRETLMVTISVARNSAYMWFPGNLGGLGTAAPLLGGANDRDTPWWKRVIRDDLAGATWAMFELSGAMILGAVPGTNAAIGAGIASAAVGSSVMGSLFA